MENYNASPAPNKPEGKNSPGRNGRFMGGLIIVAVGAIILARQTGVDFPRWIFSFKMLLIVLGLYLGFRHNFKGFAWLIPMAIGTFFLLDDLFPYYDIEDYFWPLAIIGMGLYIMFRPSKKIQDPVFTNQSDATPITSTEDVLDSVVIFGGIKKNVISKTFRGGEAVSVFGGTEINLTQADVSGRIVLELTQVFGGTKLIVPPQWKIHSDDVVAIFGGVDDKRALLPNTNVSEEKILILRGTCIFGGIDIKSY